MHIPVWNSAMWRTLRNLAALVVFAAWMSGPPARAAFECEETLDCGNGSDSSVCVSGECVSCVEDPGQCDNYTYGSGGNLISPFCEAASGRCWECTDCGAFGCDPEHQECNDSGSCTGFECGWGWECNDDDTCSNSCWYSWTWSCQLASSCAPPCS